MISILDNRIYTQLFPRRVWFECFAARERRQPEDRDADPYVTYGEDSSLEKQPYKHSGPKEAETSSSFL